MFHSPEEETKHTECERHVSLNLYSKTLKQKKDVKFNGNTKNGYGIKCKKKKTINCSKLIQSNSLKDCNFPFKMNYISAVYDQNCMCMSES